jgi:hypothetical protein
MGVRQTAAGRTVHRRVIDHHPAGSRYQRFNKAAALLVTKAVGTMTCAWLFAIFDCLALPTAIHGGMYGIVQWTASFFLQLVLLSVIMVGQNLGAVASDIRSEKTFEDTERIIDSLSLETRGGLQSVMAEIDALHDQIAASRSGREELDKLDAIILLLSEKRRGR